MSASVAFPRAVKRGKDKTAAMIIATIIITTRKPMGLPSERPIRILIPPTTPSANNPIINRFNRALRAPASGINPARSSLSR